MEFPLNIGTDGLDIQTRVVLSNETRHSLETPGMSGKVTLVGAFPSKDSTIKTVRSYAEYLSVYKLQETEQENEYDAHRAIKRIFMQGVNGYRGATQVTCVNINTSYEASNSLTVESKQQVSQKITELEGQISTLNTEITALKQRIAELEAKANLTQTEKTELTTKKQTLITKEKELATLSEELMAYKKLETYSDDTVSTVKISAGRLLSFQKFKIALRRIADEDTDLLFISSDLHDCVMNGQMGSADSVYDPTQAPNLGVVYNYLIDFINNEFTSHRPLTYIGFIRTAHINASNVQGIPSYKIEIDSNTELNPDLKDSTYGVSWADTNWAAKQITQLFTNEKNELTTCGLFYQGGYINHEQVDSMEMAAHMCGWLACGNVGQDLTYQTIPGVTGIDEEVYFGKGDAGTLLNNLGIQVIRPKDRLEKTFYVNNSINPSGWHTNHVRSVIYLLKQYAYETGLGINNITANVVAFRASLENVSKKVMDEVDLIRDVQLGDIEIINNYHLYLPIDIILAGVVTKISVGVSMTIDETGEAGTNITTEGYNFYY